MERGSTSSTVFARNGEDGNKLDHDWPVIVDNVSLVQRNIDVFIDDNLSTSRSAVQASLVNI